MAPSKQGAEMAQSEPFLVIPIKKSTALKMMSGD